MLLRTIKLNNFRQYKGVQVVKFADDPVRNVTVIIGINTSGKTTFVQAFHWALYGKTEGFKTKDILLNKEVANAMNINDEAVVEVEVTLVHDEREYTIFRSQKYRCDLKGDIRPDGARAKLSYKEATGNTVVVHDIDNTINEILPKELADYFFFDGERIETIGSKKQEITSAVKRLLGLSLLDNARQHLDPNRTRSVIAKFHRSMDLQGDVRAQSALSAMERAQEQLEVLKQELIQIDKDLAYYNDEKDRLQRILLENQQTANLQKEQIRLEKSLKEAKQSLEDVYTSFRDNFNAYAVVFFSRPLLAKALEFLQTVHLHDAGIPNMNATSIDYILSRGRCICGADLHVGTDAYENLLRERKLLPPESLGTVIRNFRNLASSYMDLARPGDENFERSYKEIFKKSETVNQYADRIRENSAKLRNTVDMARTEADLSEVKRKIRDLEEKKERVIHKRGEQCKELENNRKTYEGLVEVSAKNRQISLYIKYAEAIYRWIQETYEKNERDIREKLQYSVNNIFHRMYHGQRAVEIDQKYNISLKAIVGDHQWELDESRGLETVKNFAFVAGLVELARNKVIGTETETKEDLASEPYPLVMDAPFSNADEKHVQSISNVLPSIAEQVIMVVMEKDWSYAEPVLIDKIGKKYVLRKETEARTIIEEVSSYV
ncbi:AAA family ATPase [Sulfobacillus thermosulfidooxidans]|uniref:AAA family ATPase n=1 Tax=Sulfobacillus thermosulfidooxidans TaxID=28034 RepID=UPI0002DEA6D5|nr:AAA family ATPase [Sulfobacillus thermosulfidooxidans]